MLQMTREGYIIYQHIEFYQIPLNMIFSTEIGGGCASAKLPYFSGKVNEKIERDVKVERQEK